MLFIPILYYYKINQVFSLALLSFVAALILGNRLKLDKSYLIYFLLGIFFYLGSRFIELFVVEAVLILLYGIPNASLMLSLKKNNYNEIFINNLLFFVPVISLYFVF